MFCENCGAAMSDEARFCGQCGTTVDSGEPLAAPQQASPVVPAPYYGYQQSPQQGYAAAPQQGYDAAPQQGYAAAPPIQQKGRLKKRFIIIPAAALVVVAFGIAAVVLTGAFGLFGGHLTPMEAFNESRHNLIYGTQSGSVELRVNANGETVPLTYTWDYGSDLSSSTLWFELSSGTGNSSEPIGIVVRGDTIYRYSIVGGNYEVQRMQGWMTEANAAVQEKIGTSLDYNQMVSNGRLNQDFFAQLRKLVEENASSLVEENASGLMEGNAGSLMGNYGTQLPSVEGVSDYDTTGIFKILGDFVNKELVTKVLQDKMLSNLEITTRGNVVTYTALLDPMVLIQGLETYAESRKNDSSLISAANTIVSGCQSALDGLTLANASGIDFKLATEDSILTHLHIDLSVEAEGTRQSVSIRIDASGINSTDLDNNATLARIYQAA